jgi:hypothetical protein
VHSYVSYRRPSDHAIVTHSPPDQRDHRNNCATCDVVRMRL